jgi:hypothetical protein
VNWTDAEERAWQFRLKEQEEKDLRAAPIVISTYGDRLDFQAAAVRGWLWGLTGWRGWLINRLAR